MKLYTTPAYPDTAIVSPDLPTWECCVSKVFRFPPNACQPNVPPTTQQMIKYAAVLRTYLLQGIAARPAGLGKGPAEKSIAASAVVVQARDDIAVYLR